MSQNKTITIIYSDGQQDSFKLNEGLDEAMLQEILEQMDRADLIDIYGDLNANKEEDSDEQ